MAQYIDKSALVAEIEKLLDKGRYHDDYDCVFRDGNNAALYALKEHIDTLEVKEVDLEKYYHYFLQKEWFGNSHVRTVSEMMAFTAKHFFELGISVSNSIKVTTPDVDDVIKENGVNPDSKEAKIIKESYFMAIEKLAQKGE